MQIFYLTNAPFFARRIRPNLWASCLLEPPWDEIWIRTLASGKSNDVSATLLTKIVLICKIMSKKFDAPTSSYLWLSTQFNDYNLLNQQWIMQTHVVYFDQRMHASTCICMVEINEKHSKIIKSTFSIMRTRGSWRKMKKKLCFPTSLPFFVFQPPSSRMIAINYENKEW